MKNLWHQSRRATDTVMVKDGQETYYCGIFTDLQEAIDDFAESYDHSGILGEVRCTATDLSTGIEKQFTINAE